MICPRIEVPRQSEPYPQDLSPVRDWVKAFSYIRRLISSGEATLGFGAVFIYLQVLDLLTTLVGFRLGAVEASPFVRMLMFAGPTVGVIASKAIALGLAGLCVYLNKRHLVRWAN